MISYRLYHLDSQGHIGHAEWLNAACEADALELADLIRRPGYASQELWLRERRLRVIALDAAAALAA